MTNSDKRALCERLIAADSEADVVSVLSEVGLWDNPAAWRLYGDRENNFSTIGNQQSRPDSALVEKLVNSVDARLLHECLAAGIDPESPAAPSTIHGAVARFFESPASEKSVLGGRLRTWPDEKRREVARGITLAATGPKGEDGVDPSLSIADLGEGQTPLQFPYTFLSLEKSNKLRIPFVQGKFNMGGTGVLGFCGRRNMQLIVSRRSPRLVGEVLTDSTDSEWGFTIVRREDPSGNMRSSCFTFLAPVGMTETPSKGSVLSFSADELAIFPDGDKPYARTSAWGTLIKLYEYSLRGHRSHMLRKNGLLGRLELLLPELALPIRIHECRRGYAGRPGSYDTTLAGLNVRLDEGSRSDNVEEGFPISTELICRGETMTASIYAFKKGRAQTYRKSEGVIFVVNGQTHGHLTLEFFNSTKVGLAYLSESILVMVDCSGISPRGREVLFMNSRDRLRIDELQKAIKEELQDVLRNQPGLKALRERRRREELESRLSDSKPLESILQTVLKHSPTLANLFLFGRHASNPFKQVKTGEEERPFQGKRFPTFFKFRGKDYGAHLNRGAHLDRRCRIAFETDADNDFFEREQDKGTLKLYRCHGDGRIAMAEEGYAANLNLQNGIANLSIKLAESCRVGDNLSFVAVVEDVSRAEPFENFFSLNILPPAEAPSVTRGSREKPPSEKPGEEREIAGGLELPAHVPVKEEDWERYNFDKYTALVIKDSAKGGDAPNSTPIYDFFINVDNVHLKRFLKQQGRGGVNDRVVTTRFELAMMLTGLALIHDHRQSRRDRPIDSEEEGEDSRTDTIEQRVAAVTKAMAPFFLPMIDALGALGEEHVVSSVNAGEDV